MPADVVQALIVLFAFSLVVSAIYEMITVLRARRKDRAKSKQRTDADREE